MDTTYIRAERFDVASIAMLPGDEQNSNGEEKLAKWVDCWSRMQLMDLYYFPVWEEEVHNMLQPLFEELVTVFLAYTRSANETSAADSLEMALDEFLDFVHDCELETDELPLRRDEQSVCQGERNQHGAGGGTARAGEAKRLGDGARHAKLEEEGDTISLQTASVATETPCRSSAARTDGLIAKKDGGSSCCTSSCLSSSESLFGAQTRHTGSTASRARPCRCPPRSLRC